MNRRLKNISSLVARHFELPTFVILILLKIIWVNKGLSLLYDQRVFLLASLGSALFLASISAWFKRRTRIYVLLALDLVFSLLMLSDLLYYRYFNDVISVPVIRQAVFLDSLHNSIVSLFRKGDLFLVWDILAGILAIIVLHKKIKSTPPASGRNRAITAAALLVCSCLLITYGFVDITHKMGKKIFSSVLDRTFFVQNIGVVNFHGFDLVSTAVHDLLDKKNLPDSEVQAVKKEILDQNAKKVGSKLSGAGKGYNLIIVQAEAMQNMLMGMKVNGQEVMPNLNKFIKRSAYFPNFFSQAAQGGTSDAEFLTNVSYYPMTEGSVYFRYPYNKFQALPSMMKEKGYATVAMHAYRGSYWNRATVYPNLGFDNFVNMGDFKFDERKGWGLSDASFFRQSVERLTKMKTPFEAFLITLSAHFPYDAFEQDDSFDVAPYNHTFVGNYIKAQHYADSAFGSFIEELDQSGLMDNSIVVIYGDHAGIQKEKLSGLRNFLGLNDNDSLGFMSMSKVPLIIHFPKDQNSGTMETAGGQVDIYPTLANLFDLNVKYTLGQDLFNTSKGYALFRDGSLTDGKNAYIRRDDKCYDLVSGKPVDMNALKEQLDKTKDQLEISDKVIMHNLIKDFEK